MSARRLVRVVRTDDDTAPGAGQVVCLVEATNLLPNHGTPARERRWSEVTTDPRTNMSHQPRWHGWLGCTNDVDRWARGAWRVTSVEQDDATVPRFRVRLVEATS